MNAKELYTNGQLKQAIYVLIEEIKQQPQNIEKRDFLRELLCIAGELASADKQLDILTELDTRASIGAALIRQLIRAEQARQQCFFEGRIPEFIDKPSPALQFHLQALIEMRNKNQQDAFEYTQRADHARPLIRGKLNDLEFDTLRDLDDTTASFFEVLTSNGKYYWISFEQLESIDFYPATRPLDLIWRRAHMTIHNGPEGDVYLPTIYVNTTISDEAAKLGHKTEWLNEINGPTKGIGQRSFLIGDQTISINEFIKLEIHRY